MYFRVQSPLATISIYQNLKYTETLSTLCPPTFYIFDRRTVLFRPIFLRILVWQSLDYHHLTLLEELRHHKVLRRPSSLSTISTDEP